MKLDSRTVRVFLSSTFRDFAEERDLLVRKIFPELRRKCRERQVELVDVDLRWGITEKEAQQGKVLPICLAEIDRSRPYFMGFIGERYGWVPEKHQYDLSLIIEQPWLDEHRGGKSVTELEILHGVLNNPAMAGRAFFYFRNSAYSRKKGGSYLSEGTEEKAKLEALKDRIRKSRFPVVENYRSPENLAERVRDDLWELIDESFPESEVPDLLARERMRHEAYGVTRRRLYLGGERYFEALNKAMKAKPFRPVLVIGQSGGGKSALLANWVVKWAKRHPKASVIVHHLGCGADAADPVRMATRLMEEIARTTGDEFKPESDPDKQIDQLSQWLALASSWAKRENKEFLFVLDGLDKISDRKHLRWFPSYLPPRVKLVGSCLHGEVLEAAKNRLQWRELRVKPFTKTEQKQFMKEYLERYRKSLTPKQTQLLQSHPLSGNPLFLLTILEELRVFGVHEGLGDRLKVLLSPPPGKAKSERPTVDDVFEHVLARIESDLGKKAVQTAMEAIWTSRSGLLQDELLGIAKLAPSRWAAIQNALDESIYESGGKINFGHDHLKKAVEDRYRISRRRKLNLHHRVAGWFSKREVDARVAEELPWQWQQAGEKRILIGCLLKREIFSHCYDRDMFELVGYWRWTGVNVESEYRAAWSRWRKSVGAETLANLALALAHTLNVAGIYSSLPRELLKLACSTFEKCLGSEHQDTLNSLTHLADCFRRSGDLKAAVEPLQHVLTVRERLLGAEHQETLQSLSDLGLLLQEKGEYRAAEDKHRQAMVSLEKSLGAEHVVTINAAFNLASALCHQGHYDEAEALLRRVLAAREKAHGGEHLETLACANNLAVVLTDRGDLAEAEFLYRRALRGKEKSLGTDHPETLVTLSNLGTHLTDTGNLDAAEGVHRRVLATRQRLLGADHPQTLASVNNLGSVSFHRKSFNNAEVLYRRALRGREKILGRHHPDTLTCVNNLAITLRNIGRLKEAEVLYHRAFDGRVSALGAEHSDTLATINDLAFVLNARGQLREALMLLRGWYMRSDACADAVRYNLACYECLSGNVKSAETLILEHIEKHPGLKQQALDDPDLHPVADAIVVLPGATLSGK